MAHVVETGDDFMVMGNKCWIVSGLLSRREIAKEIACVEATSIQNTKGRIKRIEKGLFHVTLVDDTSFTVYACDSITLQWLINKL